MVQICRSLLLLLVVFVGVNWSLAIGKYNNDSASRGSQRIKLFYGNEEEQDEDGNGNYYRILKHGKHGKETRPTKPRAVQGRQEEPVDAHMTRVVASMGDQIGAKLLAMLPPSKIPSDTSVPLVLTPTEYSIHAGGSEYRVDMTYQLGRSRGRFTIELLQFNDGHFELYRVFRPQ